MLLTMPYHAYITNNTNTYTYNTKYLGSLQFWIIGIICI